jgi:plasmid stabilization system protein ParE
MRVRIEPSALTDLVEAYEFYEQSEQALGEYFLTSLFSDIESLGIFGGIHRREYRNLHRCLARTFPFAIYYTVAGDEVVIRAVLDCRRNPSWIRGRIKGSWQQGEG